MQQNTPSTLKRLYWELPVRDFVHGAQRPVDELPTALPTYDSYKLVEQAATMGVEEIVFCGSAEPKRSDLVQLVDFATRRGLRSLWTPSDGRFVTSEVAAQLKVAGLSRVAIALHGATADAHERASGLPRNTFDGAIAAIAAARSEGLNVQMNSAFSPRNIADFWRMATLATDLNVDVWDISIGYEPLSDATTQFSATEVENLFDMVFDATLHAPFAVQMSDAKHFARYFRQRLLIDKSLGKSGARPFQSYESEVEKERASLFINPDGSIWPEAQIELTLGNVRYYPLQRLVVGSPLLQRLRSTTELSGKCFFCEFRELCGGSRSRAYLATGDPLAGDPLCCYHPVRLQLEAGSKPHHHHARA